MEEVNHSWKLKFKNGTTAEADIVIGADGYRSKVRSYVTDIKPLYSGVAIIQGEIINPKTDCPEIYELVDNANLTAMDIGKTIVAYESKMRARASVLAVEAIEGIQDFASPSRESIDNLIDMFVNRKTN